MNRIIPQPDNWADEIAALMDEFPGLLLEELAAGLEANPDSYEDGSAVALNLAAAIRRRIVKAHPA